MNKIDIVIPYVNGTDPEWQKIHSKYKNNIDYTRFDGNDILKYVFRSIDMYVPFVNKVHLIVMQESQIPKWLNREFVNIVYHKDFIPEKHLPVFNSNTIEMYLWNIQSLSEHFIYINDDIIFNNVINIHDHFDSNMNPLTTLINVGYRLHRLHYDYVQCFIKTSKLAARYTKFENRVWDENSLMLLRSGHGPQAFRKSLYKIIYDENRDEIEDSITMFRSAKNLNQYLFSSYVVFHDICSHKYPTYEYIPVIRNNMSIFSNILKSDTKEICFNDTENTDICSKLLLHVALKNKFKTISKYENKYNETREN